MFKKDFWITFVCAVLITLWVQMTFFSAPKQAPAVPNTASGVVLEALKKQFGLGESVMLKAHILSGTTLTSLNLECPGEPLTVTKDGKTLTSTTKSTCEGRSTLELSQTAKIIDYDLWTRDLFKEPGTYTVSLNQGGYEASTSFEIKPDGFFGSIWNTVLTHPIYNLLIFLTTILGNDFGWAIIALTILVRLLLLIPNQKALESQKAMQKVQPKIKEIQEKYKGDQQRISLETMQLMKEHKVNPVGSCLPMLFQIPILLALFLVIQQGRSLAYGVHLYDPLQHVNILDINHIFLGFLDLSKPEIFVLPLLLAVLQYLQLRMSFAKMNKNMDKNKPVVKDSTMPDLSQMNKIMMYVLPVMIAIAAFSLPAGVGLYWLVSTLFSIGQQYVVNREKL